MRQPAADLGDVVELLEGIGVTLMVIGARLDEIVNLLKGDDDEEADS